MAQRQTVQAAVRSPSTCLSHWLMRFQLVKTRLTSWNQMSSWLSQLQGLQGSGIVKVAGVYESLPADSGSVFVRVSRLLNTARFQDCRLLLSRRFDLSRFSLNAGSTMTPALSHASYSRRPRDDGRDRGPRRVSGRESAGEREIRPRGTQWRLNHPHICRLHDVGHAAQRIPTSAIYPGIRTPQL